MGKPKRFSDYDSSVDSNRKIIENYGKDRQALSIGSSFRSRPRNPKESNVPIIPIGAGGTGGGGGSASACPLIVCEKDLGTITTATNIDWSISNFHRCVVGANITFTMTNLPPAGKYETVVLEIKQDGTGNRVITFADSFLNSHVPTINLTANGVTSLAFYTYDDGSDRILGFNTVQTIPLLIAMSDELTPLEAASTTVPFTTFRMPTAMTLTEVRSSVTTAPAGSTLTVDIHESGTTVLSTKITIDAGEKTSTTAATAPVISDTVLADDAEIELFLDVRDSSNAATGLKVTLVGYLA